METRPLGDTGLVVSRFGIGLAALGRPGYINLGHADDLGDDTAPATMEARTHAVLDAALAAGVRYVDAARSYGRAEEFLGSWLRSRPLEAESIVVGSKWGYTYTAGWQVEALRHEVKRHTRDVLEQQIVESRQRLGDSLRVYQIHSATLESGVLGDREVLEALGPLAGEGLVIGLTLSGPRQAETLRRAMAIRRGERPLFQVVQTTWNVLEPSAGPMLVEAHAAGLGVIVKEGLANGRLTARNTDPAFARRRRALEDAAARLDTTLDALALAAVVEQPFADVILSGAATIPHLRSNLGAASVALDDAARELLASLAEPPARYWDTRARLPWN